jgi:hypothetical protein
MQSAAHAGHRPQSSPRACRRIRYGLLKPRARARFCWGGTHREMDAGEAAAGPVRASAAVVSATASNCARILGKVHRRSPREDHHLRPPSAHAPVDEVLFHLKSECQKAIPRRGALLEERAFRCARELPCAGESAGPDPGLRLPVQLRRLQVRSSNSSPCRRSPARSTCRRQDRRMILRRRRGMAVREVAVGELERVAPPLPRYTRSFHPGWRSPGHPFWQNGIPHHAARALAAHLVVGGAL